MLRSLFPSVVEDARDLIVIAPHHPDRLRRPSGSPGALAHERLQQTLAWNVFRTLELISPAFWLRRLQAHLLGDSLTATPQTVRVHMWLPLTPPPAQCVDGARPNVVIDVAISTEHALWILMIGAGRHCSSDADDPSSDLVARIIDAGAWHAGNRPCFFGVVEADTSEASVGGALLRRYSRSRDSVGLRSGMHHGAAPVVGGIGVLRWVDLVSILRDCEKAQILSTIERALARNAVAWLERTGLH